MIKRVSITIMSAVLLASCGFTPALAPQTAGGELALKSVKIDVRETGSLITDEAGFHLNQRLRDRMGTGGSKHTLEIKPKLRRASLGVSGEDVASRYDLTMTATYTLRETVSGDVLDSGRVSSTSTFGAPRNPYGRDAAENNAARQVASETADRLILKLASYYSAQ